MIIRVSSAIIACALLAGCISGLPGTKGLGETAFEPSSAAECADSGSVLTVRMAVNDIYCKKSACECVHDVAARAYEDVQRQLRENHRIDLQITYFPEIYVLEEEMKRKEFDGVICKPWDAFRLTMAHSIRYKRIADLLDPDNNRWLRGMFLVKKESKIKGLSQLSGKTIAMGQPDSYEKHHLPLGMLRAKQVEPAERILKASCLEAVGELLDSKADVAVVSDYIMTASCVTDIARPDDFRIIARTPKSPLTSVILDMGRVSESDALRLQEALLAISGRHTPASLLGKGFVRPAKWDPRPLN